MMLSIRQLTKTYGHIVANNNISFEVEPGEVVGLVGENGAGKSTLLSLLSGFVQPDSGEIVIDGEPVRLSTPATARTAGIGLVHQHRTLIPTFTVREQLRLAGWTSPQLPPMLAVGITPEATIESLSPGEQQRVEIARELVVRPRLLLLDEPTSVLAPTEVEELFAAIRDIRSSGTAVIVVSHKIHEILDIADRVVVLARGAVTGAFTRQGSRWAPNASDAILSAMFPGQPATIDHPSTSQSDGAMRSPQLDKPVASPVLVARSLAAGAPDAGPPLRGVDLDLLGGQIHVIVGVDGQGQGLLADVLAGYVPATGDIELDGQPIGNLPAVARAALGVSLMAGDRTAVAAIPAFTVAENLVLKRPRAAAVAGQFTLRRMEIDRTAVAAIADWDVRPADPHARMGTLSGGNMQRVIAARDIPRGTRLLIAVNPVQGLDVRTGDLLWQRLRLHVATGAAVLVFVSDLDEALANADRLAVMFNGTVSTMVPVASWTRQAVAARMVGG